MTDSAIPNSAFHDAVHAEEERTNLEFKETLDLAQNEGKAKLAKEICAIANHGGGWIVFGRKDNGDAVDELSDDIKKITIDIVNNIADKYLNDPPFCTLRWEKYKECIDLPVVHVAEHGTIPVCLIKGSPETADGIEKGVYFIRSGTKSEPIISPIQWSSLIRQCVLQDEKKLTSNASTILTAILPDILSDTLPTVISTIINHENCRERKMTSPTSYTSGKPKNSIEFLNAKDEGMLDKEMEFLIKKWKTETKNLDKEFALDKNFIAFGFELLDVSGRLPLDEKKMIESLHKLPSYPMAIPYTFFNANRNNDEAPRFFENPLSESDGYQACIGKNKINDSDFEVLSLWRMNDIATAGVSIVSYMDDSKCMKEYKNVPDWERGKYIWLNSQIFSIDGFMEDVWSLSNTIAEFKGKARILIVYKGLMNRTLRSPFLEEGSYSDSYPSSQDKRTIDYTFQIDAFAPEVRYTILAMIVQRFKVLFGGESLNAKDIQEIVDTYLKPHKKFR